MLCATAPRWPCLLLVGLVTTLLSQPAASLVARSLQRDGSDPAGTDDTEGTDIIKYTTSPPPPILEGDDLNPALPELLKNIELLQQKLHGIAGKLRRTRNTLRQTDGFIGRLTINLTRSAQNLARADNLANGNLERTGWLDQKATVFNATLQNVISGVAEVEETGNRTMNLTMGLPVENVELVPNVTRAETTMKELTPGTKEYKVAETFRLLDGFQNLVKKVVDENLDEMVRPLLADHTTALKNLQNYTTAEWRREQLDD